MAAGAMRPRGQSTGPERLPRGPHTLSREEVAANQRARLMDAMVELVGKQGYPATTVSELIAQAGVSRKAFYEHFANKEECFLATYDAVVSDRFQRVADAAGAVQGLQAELGVGLNALFERASANPGAARLVLVEVAALGPQGIERRERLMSAYEGMLRETLGVAVRPGVIPNPLLRAIVGGYLKVLYSRVQSGAHRQLPELIPELVRWSFSYYPLAAPMDAITELHPCVSPAIGVGGRAPGTLSPRSTSSRTRPPRRRTQSVSRSFLIHSQRERILDAVAQLCAEKGYADTTLEDVAERASVSLQAFYEHFAGKEDAFLVAYEVGHSKGLAAVERMHDAAAPDWPRAVRAGIAALLEFLASEPDFAHVALVDALIATPRTAERSNRGMVHYAELLAPGFDEAPEGRRPPAVSIEAIAGGIFELCLAYTVQGHVRQLSELAPWVTYFALAPFIGPAQAGAVVAEQ